MKDERSLSATHQTRCMRLLKKVGSREPGVSTFGSSLAALRMATAPQADNTKQPNKRVELLNDTTASASSPTPHTHIFTSSLLAPPSFRRLLRYLLFSRVFPLLKNSL